MWIAVWASLCLLATSFALVTFLLDPSVLLYPERCVVFLNLSYFLLSLGYLLRIVLGAEAVSCMTTVSAANKTVSQQNIIMIFGNVPYYYFHTILKGYLNKLSPLTAATGGNCY